MQMYVCNVCLQLYVCMHACMYVGRYVCVYVSCMYVCTMYVGMYVCMYVCMHANVCVYADSKWYINPQIEDIRTHWKLWVLAKKPVFRLD